MIEEYDLIIGNRTAEAMENREHMLKKVVCLLLRIYFGVKVPDANAPFRLMKADIVNKYINRMPEIIIFRI